MKHRLAYHLQLTLFGLFTGSLLMLTTTVKSQGFPTGLPFGSLVPIVGCGAQALSADALCKDEVSKVYPADKQTGEDGCKFKVRLYMCIAVHLCDNCTEKEAEQTIAPIGQQIKSQCSTYSPVSLDKLDCKDVKEKYNASGWGIRAIVAIIGAIILAILVIGVMVGLYFFLLKGKTKTKSKKTKSSKGKGGGRGKSSTGQGKSLANRGKSSTGGGKSNVSEGKSNTTGQAEATDTTAKTA